MMVFHLKNGRLFQKRPIILLLRYGNNTAHAVAGARI